MERVAFLLEETGERLGCLLNPESLVLRRWAGVVPRRSPGGVVAGAGLADDPLLFSGGGSTELTLDLLFDSALAGSSISSEDVRELTRPLWDLAENHAARRHQPPLCRFVWGKSWNFPGIVAAVSERFELFTSEGVPRRSWLRMRMLRALEPVASAAPGEPGPAATLRSPEQTEVRELLGGGAAEGGERADQLAHQYYGDSALWRELLAWNAVDDPLHVPPGQVLEVPPRSDLTGSP